MVSVDFKIFGSDRGIYYEESERIIIFLNNHESIEDIYKTITHEVIHHCIKEVKETMDEDQEESLIFQMSWADLSL